ncbi:hypothetical protein CEXT_80331 [Caerostris extrusa]|uniref:Uncharacterized protein n=1 Tax=Caerostris extrusa TaxID=172846 RepID=A0AAV4W5H0_CAEEX|nr:hypothetical protein CEXT_80331 [Caerostris extrusa]
MTLDHKPSPFSFSTAQLENLHRAHRPHKRCEKEERSSFAIDLHQRFISIDVAASRFNELFWAGQVVGMSGRDKFYGISWKICIEPTNLRRDPRRREEAHLPLIFISVC